jgi:hypothetical protein
LGYRFWIEWWQADLERRKTRASQIDVRVTLAIPILALTTFTVQRLLDIRIADTFEGDPVIFVLGLLPGVIIFQIYQKRKPVYFRNELVGLVIIMATITLSIVASELIWVFFSNKTLSVFLIIAMSAFVWLGMRLIAQYLMHRKPAKPALPAPDSHHRNPSQYASTNPSAKYPCGPC